MLLLIGKKDYLVAQKKLKYQKKIFDNSIQKREINVLLRNNYLMRRSRCMIWFNYDEINSGFPTSNRDRKFVADDRI